MSQTDQPNPDSAASPSRSGAFDAAVDRRVERFTESISFDHRLYRQDIAGSIAHAQMLADQDILTAEECQQIIAGLTEIKSQLDEGSFPLRPELEDIHMNIEQALIDKLGDVGRKLHTGRSRNDQVSTDMRLWVRDAIDRIDAALKDLQSAFLCRCELDAEVILPAYTHLQRAQPVVAPHYWLAYIEKFQRDRDRLADCRKRVNLCSLGTAALAGTTLNIDRDNSARRLGFEGVVENSIDSSSDRDYLLETCFCLSTIGIHLSGWAEEWILWSTVEFDFISLPHEFCTGSSIMPQKINPDVLELTRGKSARVIGSLQTLLVLTKGLPLAYNRDLQEDKRPFFEAIDTIEGCLEVAAPLVAGARLKRESIESRLERGFLDATTLMEFLIKRGTPQRKAHHLIGGLVKLATEKTVTLSQLAVEDFQSFDASLDESVYSVLGVANAVAAFQSYGSTAPTRVEAQVQRWKTRLKPV
ncbi:argininosuccinate lyase [Mariniblastus fucicola]|uniref:Argininosuccinate lyase n=1 Tax=Mariniblastus fucicola TaxID=980251 RepID=A0A5B9PRY1_9BACT|nr:argininosuccinate lyase [Mariniblastus fucicola]QEG25013.1 Argininosuccinate lyase [Mariniblastus fucicola]